MAVILKRPPPVSTDLLDPVELAKIGNLEVIATRVVEGYISGRHRSPFKGANVEFAEHRQYTPGDEMRMIDWRALARTDRYYIKQFQEETNLQSVIVLDASGSMGFGMSTVDKLRYGRMAAASLARMMLHQRDAVGLAIADDGKRRILPARSRPNHLLALIDLLQQTVAKGDTTLPLVLREVAGRFVRRGLVVVISDCLGDVDALMEGLAAIHSRGHETMLLHIMAPEELSFVFDRFTRFECMEIAGLHVDLDPAAIRKQYLKQIEVFLETIKNRCIEVRCDYGLLQTDQSLGDALAFLLARRAARVK